METATRPVIPCNVFPLGSLMATHGVVAEVPQDEILEMVTRHALLDFGELGEDDVATNMRALRNEDRVLSAYTSTSGVPIYVITEADRSATTVLKRDEY